MRVISLNVNGIPLRRHQGRVRLAQAPDNADVICLQEVKAQEDQVTEAMRPRGYHAFFNCAQKKGYAGVAVQPRRAGQGACRFRFEGAR